MPPQSLSRHLLSKTLRDEQGRLFLDERRRYRYRELPDNRYHKVREGDTVFMLAARYFAGVDRPAGLFWVIADFQPTPVHDVSVPLRIGSVIAIPSLRTVLEEILNPGRGDDGSG
jgi:hypothetical protein